MKIAKPMPVRSPLPKKKLGAKLPKPMPNPRRAKIAALRSGYQKNG